MQSLLFRTFKQYKIILISVTVIIAIAVGSFIGFDIEWKSIEKNINLFSSVSNQSDYYIYSSDRINDYNFNALLNSKGINDAERFNNAWVHVESENSEDEINVWLVEDNNISSVFVTEGIQFDNKSRNGVWLSDKYAKQNGYNVGDLIRAEYDGSRFSAKIKGLVKSPENLILLRDNFQFMPDYESYGFAFVPIRRFEKYSDESGFFTGIKVKSSLNLTEMEQLAEKIFKGNVKVVSIKDVFQYKAAKAEINKGKILSHILPVVFMSVALLTVTCTMSRIAIKEKEQIGILSSLGFTNKRIKRHYAMYFFIPSATGSILSIGVAYLIALIIVSPDGTMGAYLDMPFWKLSFDFGYLVIIVAVPILVSFFSLISLERIFTVSIAGNVKQGDLTVPEKNTSIKIPSFISFTSRWNLRDILRHKLRSFTTITGVASCIIMVVCALGLNDSIKSYINKNIKESFLFSYSYKSKKPSYMTKRNLHYSCSLDARINDESASLNVYSLGDNDNADDLIRFIDESGHFINLGPDDCFICKRLADELAVNIGSEITVAPFDRSERYTLKITNIIRSVDKGVVIDKEHADKLGLKYEPDTFYSTESMEEIAGIKNVYEIVSKEKLLDSFNSYMNLIKILVIILVAASLLLGFCVIYNNCSISFEERQVEVVKLRILGFKQGTLRKLLVQQIVWLSIVGIAIGYPAGLAILEFLLNELGSEYEIITTISPISSVICVLLTLCESTVVSHIMTGKISYSSKKSHYTIQT